MKKKICQFSIVHSQNDSRVFSRECKSLSKDFDVTLIAVGDHTGNKDGVQLIPLPKFSNPIFRILFGGPLAYLKALKQDANVYHFHDPELIPYGILLSFTGARIVYDMHENTIGDIDFRQWIPNGLKSIVAKTYKTLLNYGNLFFHTVAVVEKEEMAIESGLRPGRFTRIMNYASLTELRPYRIPNRIEQTSHRLIYAGLLEDHYYHFSKILEAIFLLKQREIVVNIDVAGNLENTVLKDYKRLNFWTEIESQIQFHGYIPQSSFFELSRNARLGLCLKNQPDKLTYSHERKLFEYMALGLPSIFCENKIYRQINEENPIGLNCNLDEPTSISEAIESLLLNSNLYQNCIDNCLEQTEKKFNWESQYLILKNLMQVSN